MSDIERAAYAYAWAEASAGRKPNHLRYRLPAGIGSYSDYALMEHPNMASIVSVRKARETWIKGMRMGLLQPVVPGSVVEVSYATVFQLFMNKPLPPMPTHDFSDEPVTRRPAWQDNPILKGYKPRPENHPDQRI